MPPFMFHVRLLIEEDSNQFPLGHMFGLPWNEIVMLGMEPESCPLREAGPNVPLPEPTRVRPVHPGTLLPLGLVHVTVTVPSITAAMLTVVPFASPTALNQQLAALPLELQPECCDWKCGLPPPEKLGSISNGVGASAHALKRNAAVATMKTRVFTVTILLLRFRTGIRVLSGSLAVSAETQRFANPPRDGGAFSEEAR
jgi:hypothetical protein